MTQNMEDIFLLTILQGYLITIFMNGDRSQRPFHEEGKPKEESDNIIIISTFY